MSCGSRGGNYKEIVSKSNRSLLSRQLGIRVPSTNLGVLGKRNKWRDGTREFMRYMGGTAVDRERTLEEPHSMQAGLLDGLPIYFAF